MNSSGDSSFDKTLGAQAYGQAGAAVPTGHAHALPIGHLLGELQVERVLGEGGFGIVYLALDRSLNRHVALKEYMPGSMAGRAPDLSVALRSERDRPTFELGLRSFVNEARLLAQLDHPALVKVHRFWEERGTAYMVMPYYQGQTLRQALRLMPAGPGEPWLRALLSPLLDVLAYLHAQDIYHRDVSPENILLLPDGSPVLLDFGAARRIVGDGTQNLTAILKQGYAPIEQYAESAATRQGAWTDLYALAAVLYFVVAGKAPTPSVARLVNDDLPTALQVGAGRYSRALLEGIDACLAVRPEQRPRDVAAARRLLIEGESPARRADDARTAAPEPVSSSLASGLDGASAASSSTAVRRSWAAVAFALVLMAVIVVWWRSPSSPSSQPGAAETPSDARAPASPPAAAPEAASGAAPASTEPPGATVARPPQAPAQVASAAIAPATPPITLQAGRIAPEAPAKARAGETASPRNDAARPAAECAELLQRLSLGEDSASLRQRLSTLRCQ